MPRKKEKREGFHLKYIPAGRLNELIGLAEQNEHFRDKTVCLAKYVEAFSSTVERCSNTAKEFVAISQRILKGKLNCDNIQTARILNDLVEERILWRDKSTFKAGISAWSYKPVYTSLEMIVFNRNQINRKTDEMLSGNNEEKIYEEVKRYYDVIRKIKVSESVYEYMERVYNRGDIDRDAFVPKSIHECDTCVPCNYILPRLQDCECDAFVPYRIIGEVPTEFIPVYKLLAGKFRISRPNKESRVYTNITNLAREYRPFLRLNGQALKGIDISNSQPLIASILFRWFSIREYGVIREDVLQYQHQCEKGKFYEYFMQLNGINAGDDSKRTWFKKEFFAKVFFTKEIEKDNYLKKQFREKYPTCYEAIFAVKGGKLYSKEYSDFAVRMQELETSIVFGTNMKLIEMGFDVVNIFDSLYSDSEKAIQQAEQLMREEFKKLGINPNFKREDYAQKTPVVSISDDYQDEKENDYILSLREKEDPKRGLMSMGYYINAYGEELGRELYVNQFEIAG